MLVNMVGAFRRNAPFGTEIAFKKGLEALDVKVNAIDTSYDHQKWEHSADATIVFKWMEHYHQDNWGELAKCKGPKIVYQPDDTAFPHIQKMMQEMRKYCDYAFMYDDRGVKFADGVGYLKSQRLLLTADPELYHPMTVTKDIDVCFVGSLTGGPNHKSRMKMCQIASSLGLKTHFETDIYDIKKIVEIYNRSKVVLNHATDVGQPFGHGYGFQCRHFEAGFTSACILSNVIDNAEIEDPIHIFHFQDESNFVKNLTWLLKNDKKRKEESDLLYEELMDGHQPMHRGADILEFLETL